MVHQPSLGGDGLGKSGFSSSSDKSVLGPKQKKSAQGDRIRLIFHEGSPIIAKYSLRCHSSSSYLYHITKTIYFHHENGEFCFPVKSSDTEVLVVFRCEPPGYCILDPYQVISYRNRWRWCIHRSSLFYQGQKAVNFCIPFWSVAQSM
jgi:hypothetical protein